MTPYVRDNSNPQVLCRIQFKNYIVNYAINNLIQFLYLRYLKSIIITIEGTEKEIFITCQCKQNLKKKFKNKVCQKR